MGIQLLEISAAGPVMAESLVLIKNPSTSRRSIVLTLYSEQREQLSNCCRGKKAAYVDASLKTASYTSGSL